MFDYCDYLVRRKVLTFFGAKLHVFDPRGDLAAFAHMKTFRLKEDIRVYADERMDTELMRINATSALDATTTYDVVESATGRKVGALQWSGVEGFIRKKWDILDPRDDNAGKVVEASSVTAFFRVLTILRPPREYQGFVGTEHVIDIAETTDLFVTKFRLSFLPEAQGRIEPAMAMAVAILLCAVEGKRP